VIADIGIMDISVSDRRCRYQFFYVSVMGEISVIYAYFIILLISNVNFEQ